MWDTGYMITNLHEENLKWRHSVWPKMRWRIILKIISNKYTRVSMFVINWERQHCHEHRNPIRLNEIRNTSVQENKTTSKGKISVRVYFKLKQKHFWGGVKYIKWLRVSVIPKRNRRHSMKERTWMHNTNTEEKLFASLGGGRGGHIPICWNKIRKVGKQRYSNADQGSSKFWTSRFTKFETPQQRVVMWNGHSCPRKMPNDCSSWNESWVSIRNGQFLH